MNHHYLLFPAAYDLLCDAKLITTSASIWFSALTIDKIGVAATDELVTVIAPEARVPVVERFSLSNVIAPLLSVMLQLT